MTVERVIRAQLSVPRDWELVPLGAVVPAADYGTSRPVTTNGGTPVLGMQHISEGQIVRAPKERVDLPPSERRKLLIQPGELLLNRTNSLDQVGKCAVVPEWLGECTFASYLVRLQVDSLRAVPEFLARVMTTAEGIGRLRTLATPGVSQYNINPTTLRRHYLVRLPPLSEQRAILGALRCWDAAVTVVDQMATAKCRFKRALAHQLLTGKRRFKEFEGRPWKTWHLGDLFTERSETNRPDLPLLAVTGNRGVIPRNELERRDTSNADKSKYLRIGPGDIGYNTMRMWQGVSALSALEGIVSPAYTICIPGPAIDGPFASQLFKLPAVVHLFHRFSQGLVKDTLNLKFPQFARVPVTIPEVEEQRAIGRVLSAVDREVELLDGLRDALDRQRRGVAELLLTGKVRLLA
jgi:type I restriction enzyme S subunit